VNVARGGGAVIRWFKHLTDASDDEFILLLEEKFGLEGYARWWKLCEAIASRMKKNDIVARAELPWSEWCHLMRAKKKVLLSFLELTGNQSRTRMIDSGNILTIELPKLLKFRDEYGSRVGTRSKVTPDNVHLQETETETEETKALSAAPTSLGSGLADWETRFEERWLRYPNKEGKPAAKKHFHATVKTAADLARFDRAMENYFKHLEIDKARFGRLPKNGSTWFNNWQDEKWEKPPDPSGSDKHRPEGLQGVEL
jgi:hypothetical protein